MATTPKLTLTLMATNSTSKEAIFNEAALAFEIVTIGVVTAYVNAAPASPVDGDAYIVGSGTGVFGGHSGEIAFWYNGWRFITPSLRMAMYVVSEGVTKRWSGSDWDNVPAAAVVSLTDLSDVAVATPLDGHVLQYNETTGMFENVPLPATVSSTADLADWDDVAPEVGQVATWDGVQWTPAALPSVGFSIKGAADADLDTAADGQLIGWSDATSSWVPVTPIYEIYVDALTKIGDVEADNPQTGQNLVFNGAAWVPGSAVALVKTAGDAGGGFAGNAGLFFRVSADEQQIEYHDILFEDIGNIDLGTEDLFTGAVLKYDAATQKWVPGYLDITSASLGDLTNVNDDTIADEQVLRWNATTSQYEPWTVSIPPQLADWKDSVRVAAQGNIDINTAMEPGDAIDGVVLVAGDRVLLKAQTTASQNGIYTVPASGAALRAADANDATKVTTGLITFVSQGTDAGKFFILTTSGGITLGTTSLTFSEFTAGGSFDLAGLTDVALVGLTEGQILQWDATAAAWSNVDLTYELVLPAIGGNAGRYLRVKADGLGLEWGSVSGGGGSASYPDFTDNAGKVLTVNATEDGVEWVAPASGSGGGVGEHAYWRIRWVTVNSDQYAGVADLTFNGALPTGGTPLYSTQYSTGASGSAASAFDGNIDNWWFSEQLAVTDAYIGYQFAAPVSVSEVALATSSNSTRVGYLPTVFAVEYSDDGVTWTEVEQHTPDTWTTVQTQTFEVTTAPPAAPNVEEAPQDGKLYARKDGSWVEALSPVAISTFAGGALADNEVLIFHLAVAPTTFPPALSGSYAKALVAPTAAASLPIEHNGTQVGTLDFALGVTDGTFTFASAVTLAAGDSLQLIAPTPADATLAGVSISLKGIV